jgi:hypothetical protein
VKEVTIVEQSERHAAEDVDLPEHEQDEHRRRRIDPDPEPSPAAEAGLPEHVRHAQEGDETAPQPESP